MDNQHPSSFRDPSGFVFEINGEVFRRINRSYFDIYAKLIETGLYGKLVEEGWLVPHEDTERGGDFCVIKPEQLFFITYPYEWSFSQLKEAALLTLRIHLLALDHGLVLKDASAFNVQFHNTRPLFIDSLSFGIYSDGAPWAAYGQFCRHFLAPLLLMKYLSPDLNKLQMTFLDGVPLEVTSKMLPFKTHLSPFIKANIHLHASSLNTHKDRFEKHSRTQISLKTQQNIAHALFDYISEMTLKSESEWSQYYSVTNYDNEGFQFKETTVKKWISEYGLKKIWDVGANNGHFSRLIKGDCDFLLNTDSDPVAVEENYKRSRGGQGQNIVPLVIDFTNPSAGIGFANKERMSFSERTKKIDLDCVMALALIHHLCISANCSFDMLAKSFSLNSKKLIIEFVPPEDSWAKKLLKSKRENRSLFLNYNKKNFEEVFCKYFHIIEKVNVPKSRRILYFMNRVN